MDPPNSNNTHEEQHAPHNDTAQQSINNLAPIINNPSALMKSAAAQQQQASTSSTRKRPPPKQLNNKPPQRRSRLSIDAELITDANQQQQQQCSYATSSLQRHKSDECNIGGDCNHCRDEAATGIINLARGGAFNNTAADANSANKLPPIQPQQHSMQRPPSVVNSQYNPQASLLAAAAASLPPTSAIPPNLSTNSPAMATNMNIHPHSIIGTASIGTAQQLQQQQQQQSNNNTYHNSIVQLTIVKCKPSYNEPWNKLPMERVVGIGVIIPWTETLPSNNGGVGPSNNGTNNRTSANGTSASGVGSVEQGIRILTTASLINHATSILGQNQSSTISIANCTVDYISPSLDLALLKVNVNISVNDNNGSYGWDYSPSAISYIQGNRLQGVGGISLPRLGEEVMIVGYTDSSSSVVARQQQQQHNRGTISGYHAIEDDSHILRMKINLHTNNNGVENCSGYCRSSGVVVNISGQIVGIVSSTSSSTSQDGFASGIPGCVIGNFLNQCSVRQQQQINAASSPQKVWGSSKSSPAVSNSDSHDTGDEISNKKSTLSFKGRTNTGQRGDSNKGIKYLPGIPNLGITGYQTLENKALQQSLGLEPNLGIGVRILGINHTVHPSGTTNTNDQIVGSHQCNEDKKCHTSMLRTDDVLLAVDDEPVQCDGTIRLTPSRPNERVDFRWLISQRQVGSTVKLDVIRQRKKVQIHATLSASRHLVPKIHEVENEEDTLPSYVICGGCVFVPLTEAWLLESSLNKERSSDVKVFQRYLQELRKGGDQQIIILSHVLADSCNIGYHDFQNMILTSVNGQRPITNMHMLMDVLVKKNSGSSIEFRLSNVHVDRAKVVICMNANEVMESETRILNNYGIESWCSGVSSSLRLEAEGKAHRHGAPCCLKTMRALRNAVRQTTLVVPKQQSSSSKKNASSTIDNSNANDVSVTRRIIEFGETHKMQSAPLFAGKYTEEGGWTQVKTKHLSQLCACGKSTRFYCICSIGVMRCKDCFLAHCKDHSGHTCTEACGPNCNESGADVIADGVELVTTHKRKRNNPAQAIQSRCVVCKAKTCYCCSSCGFEKEAALCHVSTGRNCLQLHATEKHSKKSASHNGDDKQHEHSEQCGAADMCSSSI